MLLDITIVSGYITIISCVININFSHWNQIPFEKNKTIIGTLRCFYLNCLNFVDN